MHVFVSAAWVNAHTSHENVRILDASIPKVVTEESMLTARKIVGATLVDFKAFSDPEGRFPNTFPSAERFEETVRNLGIRKEQTVVIYDDKGLYSAARIWFLFKQFGHEQCYILDGGLYYFRSERGDWELRDIPMKFERSNYTVNRVPDALVDCKQLEAAIEDPNIAILDARSADRFHARVAEPREGLRSGHIPNSFNIPYSSLLRENGRILPQNQLYAIFEPYEDKEIWCSCGSGVTACVLYAAAASIGFKNMKIYDGSWTEWATLFPE
ncbi:MAG: sulfurtransferase [Flavobacteriaceae bacterium]|nr:sulfurtransferase [Flavobacteriaceae bacterium]